MTIKMHRIVGGRAKRILKLDKILHWQLGQSMEGYLGYVITATKTMFPQEHIDPLGLLKRVGISFTPAPPGALMSESPFSFVTPAQDHMCQKGFATAYFGVTVRWGM